MDKNDLLHSLSNVYAELIDWLEKQDDARFGYSPNVGKWSIGEHAEHLVRSTSPINFALRVPKFALKMLFKNNDRPERTYKQVVDKYELKLKNGAVATGTFIPTKNVEKVKVIRQLRRELMQMRLILGRWTEDDLSKVLLPHPILGKLTVREMFYFTIYHTEHHLKVLKTQYSKKN